MSVSGLKHPQRVIARDRTVQAALLALENARKIHYTQGSERWQGIDEHKVARKGHYPTQADCSSLAAWCLWNGLFLPFGLADRVNGLRWTAGYTGTMAQNGNAITNHNHLRRGDCVLYGPGPTYSHVAIVVGRKHGKPVVVSHGSEPGPFLLPFDYRPVSAVRRYI